jgi:hypothetical protein
MCSSDIPGTAERGSFLFQMNPHTAQRMTLRKNHAAAQVHLISIFVTGQVALARK